MTFHTRAGAEAAKQDLQVIPRFSQVFEREKTGAPRVARIKRERELPQLLFVNIHYSLLYKYHIHIRTNNNFGPPAIFFSLLYIYIYNIIMYFCINIFLQFFSLSFSLKILYHTKVQHTLALDSSWHGLMLRSYFHQLPLSVTHVYTRILSFFLSLSLSSVLLLYIYIYIYIYYT